MENMEIGQEQVQVEQQVEVQAQTKQEPQQFWSRRILVGFVIAALIGGIAGWGAARLASPPMRIGYVDGQKLMQNFPSVKAADQELRELQADIEKRFEEESKGKNQEEQQAIMEKYRAELINRNQELSDKIDTEIKAAIAQVAQKQKLGYVTIKDALYFGGVDITDQVLVIGSTQKAPAATQATPKDTAKEKATNQDNATDK